MPNSGAYRVSIACGGGKRLSMKKRQGKRHSPEQIIRKLREADTMLAAGKTIGQMVQALEISEQTFHRWRNQYGGMKAEEAKRLKELLAEAELDKAILKEAMEGNYRARRGGDDQSSTPSESGHVASQ